jgi:hypothetical protein
VVVALPGFPHRAMKVAQVLAAHGRLNIPPHEEVNIACKEAATIFVQISLFKKSQIMVARGA